MFGDAILSPDPVSKPILGTEETVNNIDRDSITQYMSSYYSNNKVVVAVTGNVEHDKIVELAASSILLSDVSYHDAYQDNKSLYSENILLKKDIQQAHICYGFKTFGYIDDKRIPLRILMTILGGGMSSRLFQNLRERHGLCYTVYSYSELMHSTGFVATYAATESVNIEKVIKIIEKEHVDLTHSNLDRETLERTKSHLAGSMILGLESTSNRMNRLARHEIYLGRHYDIRDTIEKIISVEQDAIKLLAEEIFDFNASRTVVVTE
jgi:predicted Zn-dependent peptidase